MGWWRKAVVSPVRRLAARMRRRRKKPADDGGGVRVKLHDEIMTCGYGDLHVMWEILQRAETATAEAKLAAAGDPPSPPPPPPPPPSKMDGAPALVWLRSRRHRHSGGGKDLRQWSRRC